MKPRDYFYEYLQQKLGREPTAEEYIAKNGVDAEDIEAEMVSMAPHRLQKGIERLANEARKKQP
jgi:hypothetical protein